MSVASPPGTPASKLSWKESALRRTITGGVIGLLFSVAALIWLWWSPENPVALRGVDLIMRIYAGGPELHANTARYVFVDADDATCVGLRATAADACETDGGLLRDHYADAIKRASDAGARLIL